VRAGTQSNECRHHSCAPLRVLIVPSHAVLRAQGTIALLCSAAMWHPRRAGEVSTHAPDVLLTLNACAGSALSPTAGCVSAVVWDCVASTGVRSAVQRWEPMIITNAARSVAQHTWRTRKHSRMRHGSTRSRKSVRTRRSSWRHSLSTRTIVCRKAAARGSIDDSECETQRRRKLRFAAAEISNRREATEMGSSAQRRTMRFYHRRLSHQKRRQARDLPSTQHRSAALQRI
jgi:hypothetical protein